jgi:hypothetical protein
VLRLVSSILLVLYLHSGRRTLGILLRPAEVPDPYGYRRHCIADSRAYVGSIAPSIPYPLSQLSFIMGFVLGKKKHALRYVLGHRQLIIHE